jgi:hypothetical protein
MTTVNVTTTTNTVAVTAAGATTTVTTTPTASTITATTVGPQGATGAAGPAGAAGPPKAITLINPLVGDNITLFYTQVATTLTEVRGLVRGTGSPTVTYSILYDANRAASGTAAVAGAVISSSTTGNAATIQNMPIPVGNYVWLEVTGITGDPSEVNLTVAV